MIIGRIDASLRKLAVALRKTHGADHLEAHLRATKAGYAMVLKLIVIPAHKRGSGKGKAIVRALCEFADAHRLRFYLTPAPRYDRDLGRLIRFYRSFGFDWCEGEPTTETMVRYPNEGD